MKHTGRFIVVALALAAVSCGGGGGGGGSGSGGMYVQSCTLGCTNGVGGKQVSCGIVDTFQNQEIGILFSDDVSLASAKKPNAFKVLDVTTGAIPPGTVFIDPGNPRRLIFRPKLSFDSVGNPIYGFAPNAAYQILVPGTAQGDLPPFVESTSGKENTSRLQCTIVTDQGLIDPVPGAPTVDIFVDRIDPLSGVRSTVLANGPTSVTDVALDSKITFVFHDMMNLGTVVNPSTGQAPYIHCFVDPDGNIADPTDQVPVTGSFTFNVDQTSLLTTAVFTPSGGFPSAGSGATPRRVLVTLTDSIRDLVGHALENFGTVVFTPQKILFPPATLPPGGEQFTNTANMDARRSGADWGASQPGRLKQGTGGGSGRLGDLVIKSGQTVVLNTSPTHAQGRFVFTKNPSQNQQVIVNGATFVFKLIPSINPNEVLIRPFISYTMMELATKLNASVDPLVTQASYAVSNSNSLLVTFKTAGSVGNVFTLAVNPATVATLSGPTLAGGIDNEVFTTGLLTNDDLSSGGTVTPITISDGVFEFDSIDIQNGGTLALHGTKPARLLTRGRVFIDNQGVLDISGRTALPHQSDSPEGELGTDGGPFAGFGGRGGDRVDDSGNTDLLVLPSTPIYSAGIENPNAQPEGADGGGVGAVSGKGSGIGGVHWPVFYPTEAQEFGDLQTNDLCDSEQVGGPGSGGAYATDGQPGVPIATNPISTQGKPNTPPPTAGGDAASVGLEPPGSAPVFRKLSPRLGYLRGGAGGGGAGCNLSQTGTTATTPIKCLNPNPLTGAFIDIYRTHSGAAGGGGGGAVQVQAGGLAQIRGVVDASGGDGGSRDASATVGINGQNASPGGGGSGGAILMQSKVVDLTLNPGRLTVAGGFGGVGVEGSLGGDGGAGLVRLEALTPLTASLAAQSIAPIDPTDPTSLKWLSVGTWVGERRAPESFSGAQSCWMKPPGTPFIVDFEDDTGSTFGWNMDLILKIGSTTVTAAYRGSTVFGGNSPQQFWGDLLNRDLQPGEVGAPVIVRFQGVKSTGSITDFCNLDVNDPSAPIDPTSLTPWVRHPAELNQFSPRPNMIRFVIVFDASHPDLGLIKGITNLRIQAQPD